MIEFIKKNYIYVNVVLLCLTLYIIFLPVIEKPIKAIIPEFNECPYLKITGKPCPLCGGTRYIKNLPQVFNDITYLFNPFGVIMLFIFFELIYRAYNLITIKKEKTDKQIKIDLIVHAIALICFIIYYISFMLMQK